MTNHKSMGIREAVVQAVIAFGVMLVALRPAHAQEGGVERLSFDRAVQISQQQNPGVRSAVEEIHRAAALVTEVRSQSLPTLTGSLGYTRLDANRVSGGTVIDYAGAANGYFNASVPLIAPKAWAQWSHATDNVDVARLSLADAKRQIAVLTAHTYLSVVAQHRVIDVEEVARDNAQAHVAYTTSRADAGLGAKLDAVRAEQEFDTDVSQLEQSFSQLVRGQEALGVLLGVDHRIDTDVDVHLEQLPSVDDALKEAPRDRADVQAADERLQAAKNVVRDDYTDYLPVVSGSFTPFFYTPGTPSDPDKGWIAMVGLTLPLYDGGLRYGLAHERDAVMAQNAVNLEGVRTQALSDVRTAADSLARARLSLAAATASAGKARQALEMSTVAYRAGASTNIEVIDAERVSRDADTAAAVAEDSVRQASVDLLAASGRFPSL